MSRPETDLDRLLAGLEPVLDPVVYAFVQLPPGDEAPVGMEPLARIRENEGTTLIVDADEAWSHGWEDLFPCRRITLRVYSSLEAVGMLAAVAGWLTEAGIPANTVSAVAHDHLFVPPERADEALELLERRSREHAGG